MPNDNLVLQNDRIRAINHDTRAVLAHDSEQRIKHDDFLFDAHCLLELVCVRLLAVKRLSGLRGVSFAAHTLQLSQLDVPIEANIGSARRDRLREGDVDELRAEL